MEFPKELITDWTQADTDTDRHTPGGAGANSIRDNIRNTRGNLCQGRSSEEQVPRWDSPYQRLSSSKTVRGSGGAGGTEARPWAPVEQKAGGSMLD